MTHREACYELRRTNALYTAGKITRPELFASLDRILTARSRSATSPQPVPAGGSK